MNQHPRRRFLTKLGGLTVAKVALLPGISTADNDTDSNRLSGRFRNAEHQPLTHDFLHIPIIGEPRETVYTNEGGRFRVEFAGEWSGRIGYYRAFEGHTRIPAPIFDGSPDLYSVSPDQPQGNSDNLGQITLPEGHLLNVKVKDGDGEPFPGANIRIVHYGDGGGFGTGWHTTNEDGYLQYKDAEQSGIELIGKLRIQVNPPDVTDIQDPAKERSIEITDKRTEEFTLNI